MQHACDMIKQYCIKSGVSSFMHTYTISSNEEVKQKNYTQYCTFPSPLQYVIIAISKCLIMTHEIHTCITY